MGKFLCGAKGVNGQLYVYEDKVSIERKGILGTLGHGFSGNKEILINQISSLQFRKAGMAVNGFIQFAFLGGTEVKGGIMKAASDENSIVFNIWQNDDFEKVKHAIDERIAFFNQPQIAATNENDIPTQIKKLAELKELGIIDEDEFKQKKAELLARM